MGMKKTYSISVELELDEDDNGNTVVRAIRTGENEFVIDTFDGVTWEGYCFRLSEQISVDARELWLSKES